MKVMVTGASGFIGRYVVEALLEARPRRCRGRDAATRPRNGADGRLSHRATDYSEESLMSLLPGIDAVVHLAGRRMTREDDPNRLAPFIEPNVLAVENLMRAAKAGGRSRCHAGLHDRGLFGGKRGPLS